MPLPLASMGVMAAKKLYSGAGGARGIASKARGMFGRRRRGRSRGITPARLSKVMMVQAVLGKSSPAVKIMGLKLISGRF